MNLMDCDRPGFCAIRITASPHEWTWTQAEQEEMARTILELDKGISFARSEAALIRRQADEERGPKGKLPDFWRGALSAANAIGNLLDVLQQPPSSVSSVSSVVK